MVGAGGPTLTDLVEAVGRAIADADREDYMEDCERYDDRARAVLTAIEAAGFVIVPKEPTEAMCDAGDALPLLADDEPWNAANCDDVWRAMVAAAPKVKP